MADFWQTSDVVTLHNLRLQAPYAHTSALQSETSPTMIAAVIPVRVGDFHARAMRRIVTRLCRSGICERIILVLNGACSAEYQDALRDLAGHPPIVDCIWAESPEVQGLFDRVEAAFGPLPRSGKGLAVWLGLGFALHHTHARAIAFQDADVEDFNSELFARLCSPLLNRDLDFAVSKGFYPRTGTRLFGRVTRLMLLPALLALQKIQPDAKFANFVSQFRYPLSGEIAMRRDFAWSCPLHAGWSLEIGALWQMYQVRHSRGLCQVELSDLYQHRHHPISSDDPGASPLAPMATEIAASLLRYLHRDGSPLRVWQHKPFLDEFARCTVQVRQAYRAEAIFNGLPPHDAEEEAATALFQACLERATGLAARDAQGPRLLPAWNRVADAIPDCASLIRSKAIPVGAATAA